jgi:hypothetical protein
LHAEVIDVLGEHGAVLDVCEVEKDGECNYNAMKNDHTNGFDYTFLSNQKRPEQLIQGPLVYVFEEDQEN